MTSGNKVVEQALMHSKLVLLLLNFFCSGGLTKEEAEQSLKLRVLTILECFEQESSNNANKTAAQTSWTGSQTEKWILSEYLITIKDHIQDGKRAGTAIFDQTKPLYLTNQNSLYLCVNQ